MKHLFFLGIAGHAMGALALAAKQRGFTVSGLDEAGGPPMSIWLDDHKLAWSKTFERTQLQGVDTVVVSGQHGHNNHPVIVFARENNLRIVSFAELLGELTLGSHVVAVAGTHGKTTTASLIAWLLESAGRRPDFLVGIRPFNFKAASRLNGASTVVVEADEYKASTLDSRPKFTYYHPDVLVLTSVEHDHPDVYPALNDYLAAFTSLVTTMSQEGSVVVCKDDVHAMQIASRATAGVVTYGLHHADFTAKDIAYTPAGIEFDVIKNGENLGRVATTLFGRHNVLNALAAVAVVLREGVSFKEVQKGAASFKGAFRRFNVLTPPRSSIAVIDDYAHHPTEAQATIAAVKMHYPGRRLVAIYRPHTYSRTQALLKEYQQAFTAVDELYMTDVEPARELANQRTVSGQEIIDGLPVEVRKKAHFVGDREVLAQKVVANAKPGDVILCMTVSGYGDLANELAAVLQ